MTRWRVLFATVVVAIMIASAAAIAMPTFALFNGNNSNVAKTTSSSQATLPTFAKKKISLSKDVTWVYVLGNDFSTLVKYLQYVGFNPGYVFLVKAVNAGKLPIKVVRLPVPRAMIPILKKLPGVVAVTPMFKPTIASYFYYPEKSPIRATPKTYIASLLTGAQAAWKNLGIDGKGIKVAVVDSGIDFASPGLYGKWAVDPRTGWPICFDPFSLELYMLGKYGFGVGENLWGRMAYSHYANTTSVVVAHDGKIVWYNPFLHRNVTYIVKGIYSYDNTFHIGLDPDMSYMYQGITDQPFTVLVAADQNGTYDRVYVDLNLDYNFSDDQPITKAHPIAIEKYTNPITGKTYLVSSGLVYFIANGKDPIPFSDVLFGKYAPIPGNGDLVAFMYAPANEYGSDHGTLCAAAVAGAPSVKLGASGTAPGVKLIAVGNFYTGNVYWSILYTVYGNDGIPNSPDDPQVVSMSFGGWYVNSGWDLFSKFLEFVAHYLAPSTLYVCAAGNEGPGYGTVSAPGAAPSLLTVGGSTEFWVFNSYQRMARYFAYKYNMGLVPPYGQMIFFAGRGPTALGQIKPDVSDIAAWALGYVPLWEMDRTGSPVALWGGTSLATPLTAGIAALVYEAWIKEHGSLPYAQTVKEIIMSTATNLGYPPLVQGTGFVNAYRAVKLAMGNGTLISPTSLQIGETNYPAFLNYLKPGDTVTRYITITSLGENRTYIIEPAYLKLIQRSYHTITINLTGEEIAWEAAAHGVQYAMYYVKVPVNPKAALIIARLDVPHSIYNPNFGPSPQNLFHLETFLWIDLNHDGVPFVDIDGNGVITGPIDTNHDGILEPNEPHGEMEFQWIDYNHDGQMQLSELTFELMGVNYMYYYDNEQYVAIGMPYELMQMYGASGLYIGIYQDLWNGSWALNGQKLTLEIDEYTYVPSVNGTPQVNVLTPQVSVGAGQSVQVPIKVTVPQNVQPGVYTPVLLVSDGEHLQVVPLAIDVVSNNNLQIAPKFTGTPYENDYMTVGCENARWAFPDEGDWKEFYFYVPQVSSRDYILAKVTWEHPAADVDTYLLGPVYAVDTTLGEMFGFSGNYSARPLGAWFGPYSEGVIGSSVFTFSGSEGYYVPYTNTGNPTKEIVAAKATMPGLYGVRLHLDISAGQGPEPIHVVAGVLHVQGSTVMSAYYRQIATTTLTFTPNANFNEPVTFQAYGPTIPTQFHGKISKTGTYQLFPIEIRNSKYLRIDLIDISGKDDLDLYLLNSMDQVVAYSATPSGNETIQVFNLPDGLYYILVYGYYVVDGRFLVNVYNIQNNEIQVIAPQNATLMAGVPIKVTLKYLVNVPGSEQLSKLGGLYAVLAVNIGGAPHLITIPIHIHVKLRPILNAKTGVEPEMAIVRMPMWVKIVNPDTQEPLPNVLVAFQLNNEWPVFYITNSEGIAGPFLPTVAGNLTIYAWINGTRYSTTIPVVYDQDKPWIENVTIENAHNPLYTLYFNKNEINVSFQCGDPTTFVAVAKILIDGKTVYTETFNKNTLQGITSVFAKINIADLSEGQHTLTLMVEDYYAYLYSLGVIPQSQAKYFEPSMHTRIYVYSFVIDRTPPKIEIISPANGTYTTSSRITIVGRVIEKDLKELCVNGKMVWVWYPSMKFVTSVDLNVGANKITITAVDYAGNVATKTLVVYRVNKMGIWYKGQLLTAMTSGETLNAVLVASMNGKNITIENITITAPLLVTGFDSGKVVVLKYNGTTYLAVYNGTYAKVNGNTLEETKFPLAAPGYTYFLYGKQYNVTDQIYVVYNNGKNGTYNALTMNCGVSSFPVVYSISGPKIETFTWQVTVKGFQLYQIPMVKDETVGGAIYPIYATMIGGSLKFFTYINGKYVPIPQAKSVGPPMSWVASINLRIPKVSEPTNMPIVGCLNGMYSTYMIKVYPGKLTFNIKNPQSFNPAVGNFGSRFLVTAGQNITIKVLMDGMPAAGATIMISGIYNFYMLSTTTNSTGVAMIKIPKDWTNTDLLYVTVSYTFKVGYSWWSGYDVSRSINFYLVLNSPYVIHIKMYTASGKPITPGQSIPAGTEVYGYLYLGYHVIPYGGPFVGPTITVMLPNGTLYTTHPDSNGKFVIPGKYLESSGKVLIGVAYTFYPASPSICPSLTPFDTISLQGSFTFNVTNATAGKLSPAFIIIPGSQGTSPLSLVLPGDDDDLPPIVEIEPGTSSSPATIIVAGDDDDLPPIVEIEPGTSQSGIHLVLPGDDDDLPPIVEIEPGTSGANQVLTLPGDDDDLPPIVEIEPGTSGAQMLLVLPGDDDDLPPIVEIEPGTGGFQILTIVFPGDDDDLPPIVEIEPGYGKGVMNMPGISVLPGDDDDLPPIVEIEPGTSQSGIHLVLPGDDDDLPPIVEIEPGAIWH